MTDTYKIHLFLLKYSYENNKHFYCTLIHSDLPGFFFSLPSADQQQLASLFLTALNSVKHDCSLSLNSLTA